MGSLALLALIVGGFIIYEALKSIPAQASSGSSGGTSLGSAGGIDYTIRNFGGVSLSDKPVYPLGTVFSTQQLQQMAQSVGFTGQGLANIMHVIQNESGGNPNIPYAGPIHSDAAGLLQYISTTAKGLGVENRLDPMASLRAAFTATNGGRDWCNSPWRLDFAC